MKYEEALQIAIEELDDKIEHLSETFKGFSAKIEGDIYSLSMARKALIQSSKEKREWVGLTDAEVTRCQESDYFETYGCHLGISVQDAIRKAEAKLKELNSG